MITPTMDILKVANVYVGLRVCNSEREQGEIKQVDDLHNVYVKYDNGNMEWHCLVQGCTEKNEDGIEVDFYSPLFYILQPD